MNSVRTETEIRELTCENGILVYQLTRKKVKNVNLRVKPDGRVLVSANERIPTERIDEFVRSKRNFITAALEKYAQYDRTIEQPKRYEDKERFRLLGESLELFLHEGKEESVRIVGGHIRMTVKDTNDFKRKERLMERWLRELQTEIFEKIAREIHSVFGEYHLRFPQIKIRRMRSRWGSCMPTRGIVTLNSALIEKPKACIEYVILHEFAHFIHPNHSKAFYDLVEGVYAGLEAAERAAAKEMF